MLWLRMSWLWVGKLAIEKMSAFEAVLLRQPQIKCSIRVRTCYLAMRKQIVCQ